MNITMNDAEMLKAIEPDRLKQYLQARGWYKDRPFLDNATIWLKQEAERGEFEILLPNRVNVGDYVPRVREAIATLAIVENRAEIEILSKLTTAVCNLTIQGVVMQIKTPHDDQLSGEITLLGVVNNQLQKIQTELSDRDYILAIKAYQERFPVLCTGDLIQERQTFILKNPRDLTLDERIVI